MNVYRDIAAVVMGSKGVPSRDNSIAIRRGRGRSQHRQLDLVKGESTASTFRATPVAEQTETPPHPPPPPSPTGILAMPPKAVQALVAFHTTITGQAQAGQAPPTIPPVAPLVPSPPPPPVPPQVPNVSISKKLKEARQLGCISFTSDLNATAAKDWIIQVSETVTDMKLMAATRLLEKRARTWWNSMKSRSTTPLTWSNFLREFDDQCYTYFHQKEKKREFLS
ncbi:Gag protease polyprotein, putative [Theobroma cacao]|uniref:Gag protease polyprotein, putative n=1 Tax=Theobroma cacao TaxID=3641 RepID=A0A061GRY1_THECC|nr:Gag protease polyprotein, putative [Theobroma cacao]